MTNSPTDRLLRALEPFAAEADRQERVRDYRDGDCRIVDCLVPIGNFRRARITLDSFESRSSPLIERLARLISYVQESEEGALKEERLENLGRFVCEHRDIFIGTSGEES